MAGSASRRSTARSCSTRKDTPGKAPGSLFLALLSSQKLQVIERSYVNGFGLQLQCHRLHATTNYLAAEISLMYAWTSATTGRSGVVTAATREREKFIDKHA
jgi:hypothetical protein